jgi:hypothetical protein
LIKDPFHANANNVVELVVHQLAASLQLVEALKKVLHRLDGVNNNHWVDSLAGVL